MPHLAEVIRALDDWFDPTWAESWDAVGLVCGDPDEPVDRVLLAVDPVPATVDDAVRVGPGLLITHHPLLMTGVHGVPASDPKGALVHRMVRAGVAHFVAHTNADAADPGVSDALADRIGLTARRPLEAQQQAQDKLVVFAPKESVDRIVDALADLGAGHIGGYERCAWTTEGTGTFRPGPGTAPMTGRIGRVESVVEIRVEMVLPSSRRSDAMRAVRAVHPYEELAIDFVALAPTPTTRGTGRIGRLSEPISLAELTRRAAAVLPPTSWGVRAAGDPHRRVATVAVCGGSGGSLIEDARRAGADAYLTADLRHHVAVEAVTEREPDAMALVDAAHWATEAPWLDVLAVRLSARFPDLAVRVSTTVTDPWSLHAPSTETSP